MAAGTDAESAVRIRNPLAPWVFLFRNAGRSLPLVLVIMLAVLLIAGIVAVMNSIPHSIHIVYGYSRYLTGATPRGNAAFLPNLRKHFERSPVLIERLVSCRTTFFNIRSITGPWPFAIYGLKRADAAYFVKKVGLGPLSGRLPRDGAAEAVITRPLAKNLDLRVGSKLLDPEDSKNYSPKTVRVVGIYDSDEWLAFTSYKYLAKNHFPPVDVLLLFAHTQTDQRKLDVWAEKSLKGEHAFVYTYPNLEKDTQDTFRVLFKILNLVIALLVVVITVMMAMLINIYLAQRIVEFGLLQAIGFSRTQLVRRAIHEAIIVVAAGWLLGVLCAFGLLSIVGITLMEPRGFYINPLDLPAYLYTVPVPLAILTVAALTVRRRFRGFDPISVLERRVV